MMYHRNSLSTTQWVKLGNFNEFCFVGKDTVAFGCGSHIFFYTLDGNIENVYIANSVERGDGVACIAGHRTAPIFALAERCLNPRILIFSYPALEGALATLKGGTKGPYISMAFSEMEYLVTLNGVPHFMIMVWCWRTGVQMACKETGIVNPNQRLSCSLCSPAIVSQTAQGESLLLIWELNICAKVCCLTSQEIDLPDSSVPVDISFTNDGALLYIDTVGSIFQIDLEEYTVVRRVCHSTSQMDLENRDSLSNVQCASFPCMTPCKTGVLIFQPPSLLKYHKRIGDWPSVWSIEVDTPIRWLTHLTEVDVVVGWTYKGELVTVDYGKSPKLSQLKYYGNYFIDMELVYPVGTTFTTIDTTDNLQVWNKEDGRLIGSFDIHAAAEESLRPTSKFVSVKANPCYPYVALAMTEGLLVLVSILDPTSPSILAKLLLCSDEISVVCFSPTGDSFIALSARTGRVFLMQGLPGQEIQVVAHLHLERPVVDCILIPSDKSLLALLLASQRNPKVGDCIALYTLEDDSLRKDFESNLEHRYSQLVIDPGNKYSCFGAVYCSRKIHKLEIKRKVGMIFKEAESTGHQLRFLRISDRMEHGFLTYGMDGIVITRPNGSKKGCYVVIPHHRADLGVKKAFQDPKGNFVMSLGHDGSIVCSKLKRTSKYTSEPYEPSAEMIEKFRGPTTGFFLAGEDNGITWLEYKERQRIAEEEGIAATEKSEIIAEFQKLQKKVVEMLDINEKAPVEEQLPTSAFDLDKETRESAMEQGRLHRERLKAFTLAKISLMEEKSALIKKNCWDPLDVKPTSIESLVERYKVDNYALLPETEEDQENYEMVVERRKMEMKASSVDTFHPWIFKTCSELEMQLLSAQGSVALIDETTRMKKALEEQSSSQEDSETHDESESPYVMSGSSIYHYIEPSPYHISQFELNTYLQAAHSVVLLKRDIKSLQEWFNDQFQVMYRTKEREMNTVKELHQRLRHIYMELLLTCSVEHSDADPVDPEWTQFEKPEMILNVKDKELSVQPYISPSEQAIRQQKAEEEERQRLLLLADNFRELALIKMMDGVLEIRWEDELKKDVPKPKCMIEKDPGDFNEDDLRAVKEYEEKVEFLTNERQHYRKMLDSDFKRVKQNLKESLNRFEQRLLELFELKLRVEAASTQHTLKILRSRLLNPNRMILADKETTIRNMIVANQKAMADEQILVTQLQESTADCRAAYEAQLARDKTLDGKFKKEFPELSPMMLEVAFRLYRKRPKMQAKALVSATLMNELGRCAVACKKPSYLPPECLEILKGIDSLDNITNAPPNMNPESWANICRLRRQRIESEIKIKALALQIAEAETTVGIFQKNVKALKEKDKEFQSQLRAIHEEQLNFEHNIEIQIVMKQGLVEIPITGSISDFENSVLINRKDVALINEIIKEAGQKKLHAMRAACNFRRGIIFKEWEHRKVRMHIEDKEDELKTIESVKVIKELQEWLHLRHKGIIQDRGMLTLDKEMTRIRAGFERYIKMMGDVVKNYEQQIERKQRANRRVDQSITQINVEVNELQFEQDVEHENYIKDCQKKRMEKVLLRAKLVRKVHDLHSEILALENELEGLRLRTYPVLENLSRRKGRNNL